MPALGRGGEYIMKLCNFQWDETSRIIHTLADIVKVFHLKISPGILTEFAEDDHNLSVDDVIQILFLTYQSDPEWGDYFLYQVEEKVSEHLNATLYFPYTDENLHKQGSRYLGIHLKCTKFGRVYNEMQFVFPTVGHSHETQMNYAQIEQVMQFYLKMAKILIPSVSPEVLFIAEQDEQDLFFSSSSN